MLELQHLPCDIQCYINSLIEKENCRIAMKIAMSHIISDPNEELEKWKAIHRLVPSPNRFLMNLAKRTRDMLYQFSEHFLVDDIWYDDFDAFESFLLKDFFPYARSVS